MKTEDIFRTIKGSANHDFLIDVIDCATERRAYLIRLVKGLKLVRADVEDGLDLVKSIEHRFWSWSRVPEEASYLRILKDEPKEEIFDLIDRTLENSGCSCED